jgi:hypothetical protein
VLSSAVAEIPGNACLGVSIQKKSKLALPRIDRETIAPEDYA